MKTLPYLIIFLLLPGFLQAQISRGGNPLPFKKGKSSSELFILPEFKLEKAILESISDDDYINGKKPFKIAWKFDVNLNPSNSGEWLRYGNLNVWRLEILSEDAYGLSVFFNKYKLLNDATVFIYDPSQENILGGFNYLNNKESGVLPTDFIPGDHLVIELQVPFGEDYGDLEINAVSHAYIDIFGRKDGRFGLSGSCNIDINCSAGDQWQELKYAVCRIYIAETSEYCTGTLIANALDDQRALLLTASHCIGSQIDAQSSVFYFDYESPVCNGSDGIVAKSLSSANLLATSDSLDFTLVELSVQPPDNYNPYYAGWTRSTTPPPVSTVIHHPQGDVKKISVDNSTLLTSYQTLNPPEWLVTGSAPEAFWRVGLWEVGTTEGGSSGAPLFNSGGQIIGNLTGGEARCGNSVNDYFSKFYMCWDYHPQNNRQLKHWLDPLGSNLFSFPGDEPDNIELFQLYPNPNNGRFIIATDTLSLRNSRIRVFNIQGKLIGDMTPHLESPAVFDFSRFEPGLYIIEINFGTSVIRKKFIIVK